MITEYRSAEEPTLRRVCGHRLGGPEACLVAAAGGSEQREHGEIEHTPEAMEAWVGDVLHAFPATDCAGGGAVPRGFGVHAQQV